MLDLFTALYPADLEITWLDLFLRLLCALILGAVIGTEREYTNRPAGMRTHMLVSLGACVVMIISQILYLQYTPHGVRPDPARLGAQVISGVGFLGAGTILREGLTVRGLTTAASLWATACLGLAAGCGYYAVALLGTVFIFMTLTIFELIQRKLFHRSRLSEDFSVKTDDPTACLALIRESGIRNKALISDLHVHRMGNSTGYCIGFRVFLTGRRADQRAAQLLADLVTGDCVTAAETTASFSFSGVS